MFALSNNGINSVCCTGNEAADKGNEPFTVNVEYKEMKGAQLVEAIRQVKRPEVIFWYIGVYGLRENGVRYYRKDLSKILETSEASCQLYDLTAWIPFKLEGQAGSIESFNRNVDLINGFAIPRIQCRKSSGFFEWMKSIQPGRTMDFLKRILKRPFIYKISEGFPESIMNIGDVFQKQCPLLEEMYEKKASKCYSALQYLEGIYLIQTLVGEMLMRDPASQEINLIFALPNQEYLYFQDEANSLAMDVKDILKETCGANLKGKTVNVSFYCFQFGDGKKNRPYNTGASNIDVLQGPDVIVQMPKTTK